MPIDVYTDGSCFGNPGPGGWAYCYRHGGEWIERSGIDPDSTNNRMELLASIHAIEEFDEGAEVRIYTDSQYVHRSASQYLENWCRKGWRKSDGKQVLNQDLWERLLHAKLGKACEWVWVRGHDGDEGNERAHVLAQTACEAARLGAGGG